MSKTNGNRSYQGKIRRVLVMPDDGLAPIREAIETAERSVTLKMFEFQNAEILAALIGAKSRGIEVSVMLNATRSSGLRPNDATMAALIAAGIDAHWTSARFAITHEKSMVVDGRTVLIATFNFADKYFTATRDYGLVLDDHDLAAEVSACFAADRDGATFMPNASIPLAWGNQNARRATADLIDSSHHHLWIQHPKFHDAAILDRVLAARDRGVGVRLLCGGRHGIEDYNLTDTFSYQRILVRAGVHVRKQSHPKLHAKLIIRDGERALMGSMNIDRDAYDVRRELGITFDDAHAVDVLKRRFESDWHEAKAWEAPDPMQLDLHPAIALDSPAAEADSLTAIVHE